ncbi:MULTISPECIES: GNAT family N-acetyltransferase [unclassified Streptosporangium]|uniref:GNAT family N-acetyltransferase n=1 Tax=unclassified Streptosporangium TaxID=2632669 RepID=UPI002E29C5E2|nr:MULTISPECIES: GNAT family N-acetyltransferase [unclassified Streptosporangium]
MEPTVIAAERLLLRPLDNADEDVVFAACQDPEIQRWTGIPSPYERRHAAFYLGELVPAGWRDDTMYHFAVEARTSGTFLGSVNVHRHADVWAVGYWTVAEHRGGGYALEAVLALARWTFSVLRAPRLEWRAEPGNLASWAVARKAGFALEGTLRAAHVNGDTAKDVWISSLLPQDLGLPSPISYQPAQAELPAS